jgi:thiol-disulfide isomerase/thioredoxin
MRLFLVFLFLTFSLGSCSPKETATSPVSLSVDELISLLSEETEQLTIYNFWATWCTPCLKEMPDFERFAKDHPEVKLIFVSLDRKSVWDSKVPQVMEELGIKSQVFLIEPEVDLNWRFRVSEKWKLMSIPVTLMIEGNKRLFFDAPLNYRDLGIAQLELQKTLSNTSIFEKN